MCCLVSRQYIIDLFLPLFIFNSGSSDSNKKYNKSSNNEVVISNYFSNHIFFIFLCLTSFLSFRKHNRWFYVNWPGIGDKTFLWVNMFWNCILPIKIDLNNYFYVFFIPIALSLLKENYIICSKYQSAWQNFITIKKVYSMTHVLVSPL